MAIEDPNDNSQAGQTTNMGAAFQRAKRTGEGQQAGAQPQQTSAPAPQSQGQHHPTFSFRQPSSLISVPMGRTPAAEVLTNLQQAAQKSIDRTAQSSPFERTLIPIDMNDTTSLSVSTLVVCAQFKNNRGLGVAYHTWILEGSTEPPAPRTITLGQPPQQVEVLVTMGEAYNDRLRAVVAEKVRAQFPQIATQNLLLADACVVPRDFDVENERAVHALVANASFACSIELDTHQSGWQDFNLAYADRSDLLTCRVAFPRNQVVNAVGHPVRQDITVDLTASASNQQGQQNQPMMMERTNVVSRISGYLDLIWVPANQPTGAYNPFPVNTGPQLNEFQRYVARLVMTGMESVLAPTLSCQLLTLVMAASLAENNLWTQGFRTGSYAESGRTDIHDIGAVGYEANFQRNPNGAGERVNTREDAFKPSDLGALVAAVMKPMLVISLDVEECGPSTWVNGVFAAAAAGSQSAINAILEGCNQLTDGKFKNHFPPGSQICTHEENRIHLGYYYDGDVKRDLRDIDYLAMLNLSGGQGTAVRDYSDTFEQTQYPLELRLAARKRLIERAAPSAVFTGFAMRVTFEAAFIQALILACKECNLDVKTAAQYTDVGSYARASSAFVGQTGLSLQNAGIFNRGGYSAGAAPGAGRTYGAGRWFNG